MICTHNSWTRLGARSGTGTNPVRLAVVHVDCAIAPAGVQIRCGPLGDAASVSRKPKEPFRGAVAMWPMCVDPSACNSTLRVSADVPAVAAHSALQGAAAARWPALG